MGGNYTIQLKSQSLIHQGISLTELASKNAATTVTFRPVAIPYSSGNFSNLKQSPGMTSTKTQKSQSLIHQGISLTFFATNRFEVEVEEGRNPLFIREFL